MSHGHQVTESSLFLPVLASLQEGFEGSGAAARVVDRHHDEEMVLGVGRATAEGRRPLLVTVGAFWAREATLEALKECRRAGAYLVLYSTEPASSAEVSAMAVRLGAQEVWEYAMSNIRGYGGGLPRGVHVRYLPPGYSRYFDAGVDLGSPDRQEGQVAFLGRLEARPPQIRELYEGMLGARLTSSYRTWSRRHLRTYLERYPLQLNIHKAQTCCPHDPAEPVAMEAFRMASLLTNKACVVSTPVPEEDARLWEGIVHFAEANETAAALQRLAGDVRGCQERAARLYRERFDPVRLLRDSGLFSAWRPRGKTQ